jgi:hypothetical protein
MDAEKIKPPIIDGREVKVGDKLEGIVEWTGRDQYLEGVVSEITKYEIVIDTPQGEIRAQRSKVCDPEPMNVFTGCTECGKNTDRLTTDRELPGKRFCVECWDSYRRAHPKVIVLCGSSRFVDVMAVCAWLLEKNEGAIVMGLHLLPAWYSEESIPDHLAEHEGVAEQMDELHLRKIDMADEVFVVNVKHYIGDSTTREVEYAKDKGVPIRWYTDDPMGERVQNMIEEFLKKHERGDPTMKVSRR